jgi:hypothetical protein
MWPDSEQVVELEARYVRALQDRQQNTGRSGENMSGIFALLKSGNLLMIAFLLEEAPFRVDCGATNNSVEIDLVG